MSLRLMLFMMLLFTSCSKLPSIEDSNLEAMLFTSYQKDIYGLPHFDTPVSQSQVKKNAPYYYVLVRGNRIIRVFELIHASESRSINFARSADRISDWTQEGFDFGIDLLKGSHANLNGKDALFVITLPVLSAGTAFISGIVVSTIDILGETAKLLIPQKDILLSINDFYYDPKERIKYIKTTKLDAHKVTIETEFFYHNGTRRPIKKRVINNYTGEERETLFDQQK